MTNLSSRVEGKTPIHETADYAVYVGEMIAEGELKGITGYLIHNNRTGVIEGEMNVEFAALRTIKDLQVQLDAALEGLPGPSHVGNEEVSFEEMLQRLGQGEDQ